MNPGEVVVFKEKAVALTSVCFYANGCNDCSAGLAVCGTDFEIPPGDPVLVVDGRNSAYGGMLVLVMHDHKLLTIVEQDIVSHRIACKSALVVV